MARFLIQWCALDPTNVEYAKASVMREAGAALDALELDWNKRALSECLLFCQGMLPSGYGLLSTSEHFSFLPFFFKRFEILIGFHPRTIPFLQLFMILLPHQKSVFACDSIMLRVPTSTRAFVQVDIVMNKLVRTLSSSFMTFVFLRSRIISPSITITLYIETILISLTHFIKNVDSI